MVLLGAIRGFISAEPAPLRGRRDGDEAFQTTSAQETTETVEFHKIYLTDEVID